MTYAGPVADVGAVIESPVTGERLTFLETYDSSDGELFRAEIEMQPSDYVIRPHRHPLQEERFEVLEGTLGVSIRRDRHVAGRGEEVVVPPDAPHSYWNEGSGVLRVLYENRPALRSQERFLETYYGLSRDGKMSPSGWIGLLQGIALVSDTKDYLRPMQPPAFIQDILMVLMRPLIRLRGYKGWYPEYAGRVPSDA
jgi:quercetin dioxygenase-like cupin family protein